MQNAANYLNEQLKAMFPNSGLRVHVRNILSSDCISLYYINAPSKEACVAGIDMNDPSYMHIYIASEGTTAECSVSNCHRKGVKFRKINGKNPDDVARKIVAWFKKNREAILAIGW